MQCSKPGADIPARTDDPTILAADNARLVRELDEARQQQAATSEILRVIGETRTDIQPVFDTIITSAVRLCGARTGVVFQFDGETDAILHAVAAPGGSDAGFHGAHGLAVGVAGLETGGDELAPDLRQLMHLRAEQIDALAAGDLGVQVEFLRDRADAGDMART